MHFSQSIFTPDSRIRNWSIRATLLLACVATVATSEDNSVSVVQSGAPFTLSTEQTTTTRHVTVRIAPQDEALSSFFYLGTGVRARWVPDTPIPDEAPTLLLRWWSTTTPDAVEVRHINLAGNGPVAVGANVDGHHDIQCEARRECLWEGLLEFSIDSENPGTVDMESWSLKVSIDPGNGKKLPERDISITISES